MKIDDLKKHYGDSCNSAYDEIRQMLNDVGFQWIQSNATLIRLRNEGASDKDLHLNMEIDPGTLKQAGIKLSYLIPTTVL